MNWQETEQHDSRYRLIGQARDSRSRRLVAALIVALFVVAIALFGGLVTDPDSAWYLALDKPSFQPPNEVFAPVWTAIYLMFAISTWLAWRHVEGPDRFETLSLYVINGVLNLVWTLLFFGSEVPVAAGIEILVLLLTLVILIPRVRPFSGAAALLLVPYALWVTYAAALNWAIVVLN